jgi:tRNA A-37 threonylcarbamoyl transferase component Bud32
LEREVITIIDGALQWSCEAEFAEVLPTLDLGGLRRPDELPEGALIKDSRVRTVARLADPIEPDGPGLFVKRYKFGCVRDRLRALLGIAKPQVEWRMCRILQAAGIPTCDVLAIATQRTRARRWEGFLVSREIPGCVTLREFLAGCDARGRAELTHELAELTARLADNSISHRDYHAGNLLVRSGAPPGDRLYVVDLDNIRHRPTGRRVLHMLAMLDNSTRAAGVTTQERKAFLRAFLEHWEGGPGASQESVDRWMRKARRARLALHRRHMASRTRRCMLHSSLFTPDRAGTWRIHRRRGFSAEMAQRAVRLHQAALAGQGGVCQILRNGRRTQVSICPCPVVPHTEGSRRGSCSGTRPGRVCVKAFVRDSPKARLRDLLRPRSRARTAWIASCGCAVRGIPVPRPLAVLENRWGPADYLITEAIEHEGNLHEIVSRGIPAGRRPHLGRAIAGLLDSLEREEIHHPDTKPTNLLVREAAGQVHLWLVDLDRVQFRRRHRDDRRWVKNLAQLNAGLPAEVTTLDRMRCLRACGRGRWSAARRKEIARAVRRLSMQRNPLWQR